MAVIVQATTLLSRSSRALKSRNPMSILTASAMSNTMNNGMASSTTATALQKLEEEKNKVHLVMTLAERYGGRAIQRTVSGSEGEQENQASTSPSSFQPFSSTWAARYWQLQKLKAEQALAELEQGARENET